ncbi:hypothetical protein [Brucella pseudintermedia]|uniref:hypothetical protein n=1 Tax=Brucella pseudintermedia TaxID=370111 RepID=UPI001AD71275|nr:hypothetical protein [Brucella pseudintermedia]
MDGIDPLGVGERVRAALSAGALNHNALYIDGGDILTSAGTAAAIDWCLHTVRNDYGAEIASRIARRLVVAPHRHVDQAQYIGSRYRQRRTRINSTRRSTGPSRI